MQEALFIRINRAKWVEYEHMASMLSDTEADRLLAGYNDLCADLAYCRTHYPTSNITKYLNSLSLAFHNEIYKGRPGTWQAVKRFFTHEMPRLVYIARPALITAMIIAAVSFLIGIFSAWVDPEYVRLVLGPGYVDMTIDNINKGNAAGVYEGMPPFEMFVEIVYNNVHVSFFCFVMGVLTSLASGYMLFNNFVMLGCFSVFLSQQGVLGDFSLALWFHGTLELTAIIIMGGAGIHMGNGWLFPGTYSRLRSFVKAAREGVMLVLGTMPMIIVAAVIESFLTRGADRFPLLALMTIFASIAYIVFYYIYLPVKRHHEEQQ